MQHQYIQHSLDCIWAKPHLPFTKHSPSPLRHWDGTWVRQPLLASFGRLLWIGADIRMKVRLAQDGGDGTAFVLDTGLCIQHSVYQRADINNTAACSLCTSHLRLTLTAKLVQGLMLTNLSWQPPLLASRLCGRSRQRRRSLLWRVCHCHTVRDGCHCTLKSFCCQLATAVCHGQVNARCCKHMLCLNSHARAFRDCCCCMRVWAGCSGFR
jgi:hypothetical protein